MLQFLVDYLIECSFQVFILCFVLFLYYGYCDDIINVDVQFVSYVFIYLSVGIFANYLIVCSFQVFILCFVLFLYYWYCDDVINMEVQIVSYVFICVSVGNFSKLFNWVLICKLLNQGRAGLKLVHSWWLKIDFVLNFGMRVCVCMYMCLAPGL